MAMALLAFAGFLRFDELSSLKLKDVVSHATYFELFIESSKTDQYREGAVVPIVKTGTKLCPWVNLVNYLSQAKITLPSSTTRGDDFQSLAVNLFAWDPRYLIPGVGKCYLRS